MTNHIDRVGFVLLLWCRTVRALQHWSQSSEAPCKFGHGLPELYLLGAPKGGTTTFASQAAYIGVQSAISSDNPISNKELHTFDDQCGFLKGHDRPDEAYQADGGITMSGCISMTEKQQMTWLEKFPACKNMPKGAADMTPANLGMYGLPKLMTQLYAGLQTKPHFIIMIREPVSRFQSGFYQVTKGGTLYKEGNFATYTQACIEKVRSYMKAASPLKLFALDLFVNEFFESMYSLMLEAWLQEYDADRFTVIPSVRYFDDLQLRTRIFERIAYQFGLNLDIARLSDAPEEENTSPHPLLNEDLSEQLIQTLKDEFFGPDTQNLCDMLAIAISQGLYLAGFDDEPTAAKVLTYLQDNW